VILAILSIVLGWVRPCAAQATGARVTGLPLDLTWTAPEGCPGADEVKAQIAHLTRTSNRDGGQRLEAAARVEEGATGVWRVALETRVRNVSDSRELVGDSCDAVAGSVAVVLALRLDALDEPRPEATPAPAPPAPRAPAAPPPPRAPAERPRRFSMGLALSADTSALPAPTIGATLLAAFRPGRTYLGLSGTYWMPRNVAFGGDGDGTFRFFTGSVVGCQRILDLGESVYTGPCLALEGGAMSAESFGVRVPGRTTELWLAARGGARLAVELGRTVTLAVVIEAAVPFRRPSFVVEGVGVVHRPAPVSARASVGAEWCF
jgi:hypothetical protein